MRVQNTLLLLFLSITLILGCSSKERSAERNLNWNTIQDTTHRITVIEGGLQGPESVQYDAEQDLYFIANFNGDASGDSNGFVSRAQTDGTIDSVQFMTGTENYPLHGARGMDIKGDTLFVCDQNGIHGFNRHTGEHISFTDFTDFEPGFLNDVSVGPNGKLYVTDSVKPVLYQISGSEVSVVADALPHPSNGIMFDKQNQRLVLAAWGDGKTFLSWDPSNNSLDSAGTGVGGRYDGVEPLDNNSFIVTSQEDSTLQRIANGTGQVFIKVPGKPADMGFDTKRNQVAVPYIALNRVDIWQLPKE